ncbi:F5J5.1 [Cucumis melo var. makuwa]|uniref:F5J5.1 n=1 Tax=Cucumis melo var. makuwa TaxID=1194695 RepID=A0A5A7V9A5_CUCMM|nr:F5J5.1 [Cucumis melo var. makuwa]
MPSRRHENDRYRHFQAKCATYLKRKKKSLTSTLSDEETSFVSESRREKEGENGRLRLLASVERKGSGEMIGRRKKKVKRVGGSSGMRLLEEHSTSSLTEASSNKDTSTQLFTHLMPMMKKHPISSVIGDISSGINMRKKNRLDYAKMIADKPANVSTMGTKWIFKNKIDEIGNVTQNMAQLISLGYSQIKGVDFGETFALVTRLESVYLLLGLACFRRITLYQMEVKSTFMNGFITKEVSMA